jgi:hypothetical protein
VFLERNGVTVTSSRFVTPGKMYTMGGITSVQMLEDAPRRGSMVVLGSFAALVGFALLPRAGSVLAWLAAFVFFLMAAALKATYHIVLRSSSGETQALSSQDRAWIAEVVEALTAAVVHRG